MSEPKFVPKPGQTDYTTIRYCPVTNALVVKDGKILLVQRSSNMRLYANYWHCIAGFLDDHSSVEEKVMEELNEELGLTKKDIVSMQRGMVSLHEAPEYDKTFMVVPVVVTVKTDSFTLNWEAQAAKWYKPSEIPSLKLVPGFLEVFKQFF